MEGVEIAIMYIQHVSIPQKLSGAGYKPWNPEEIPGRPRFFCRDPFGNTIEFTTIVGNYQQLEKK
jgi:hypothetical protein